MFQAVAIIFHHSARITTLNHHPRRLKTTVLRWKFIDRITYPKKSKKEIKKMLVLHQLAIGWLYTYSIARLQESILSASLSGISSLNSSSKAITISTVSKLSKPKSFWKWPSGLTCRYITQNSIIAAIFQPSYDWSLVPKNYNRNWRTYFSWPWSSLTIKIGLKCV